MKKKLITLLLAAGIAGGMTGAVIPHASAAGYINIACTDGFVFSVSSNAVGGVVTALNKYNEFNHSGVTCSIR